MGSRLPTREGRGKHWQKGGAAEKEFSLLMSILARKTRPGFRIKPWSTTTNLCGFGSLPGQCRGRVWAMPCTMTVLDKQSG